MGEEETSIITETETNFEDGKQRQNEEEIEASSDKMQDGARRS
jgi:hypothetical protein